MTLFFTLCQDRPPHFIIPSLFVKVDFKGIRPSLLVKADFRGILNSLFAKADFKGITPSLFVKTDLNPFMPNGISCPYHLDESISNLNVVGWLFSISFKF